MKSSRKTVLSPHDVKRVTKDDIPELKKLKDATFTSDLFGDVDIETLINHSFLCLKVEDENESIAGALVLATYPNVPSVPSWEWTAWLENLYGLEQVNSRNSLWIHYAAWDPRYHLLFFRPIVQYLFKVKHFLQYLLMVLPPGMHKVDFLVHLGTIVLPLDCVNPKSSQVVYIIQKQNFTIKYKIRRAVEEDNDDLIPLIETNSKRLKELYGSYYIAELLTRHKDTGRQIIVAEYKGIAVAVLILNQIINSKVLNEEFELVPFNGLKKPHPDDTDFGMDVLYLSIEQANRIEETDEVVTQIVEKKSLEASQGTLSTEDMLRHASADSSEDYSLVFTTGSLFIFQDDDKDDNKDPGGSNASSDSLIPAPLMDEYLKIVKRHGANQSEDNQSGADSTRTKLAQKIPKFLGEDSAFCLEVAAAHPDHEAGLIMLFESAFECFPDREYLVMSMPCTVPMKKLSSFFSRIAPRPDGAFPYEVFVMHKNTMLTKIKVEPARSRHEQQIRRLLATIPNQYYIQHQFEAYRQSPNNPYSAYVMLSGDQVVAFALLTEENDVNFLQRNYDLASVVTMGMYKSGTHGLLETLVLSPIFEVHAKFFLRELHRLSDFSILYYKHLAFYSGGLRDRPLLNILPYLFPIMPRSLCDYEEELAKQQKDASATTLQDETEPFTLYISVMPLCSIHKYTVNNRIVIIGSNHTALSFVESLILTQDIRAPVLFNNVTLVGIQGFNNLKALKKVRDSFTILKNFNDSKRMDMISLRTYVNLMQGKLHKIDRKEQVVILQDNTFLPYDLLFLMTGEQFKKPERSENPENVFLVNNAIDANRALAKLKEVMTLERDPDYIIVVYGHFLQAYVTLFGLLNFGVPGSHIVFVEPFPYSMEIEKRHRHNVSIFNDPDIDGAVMDRIMAEGIEVYSSYYFIDWEMDPSVNIITSVKFEAKHHMLEVPCTAMFFFNNKGISTRLYKVITEAGLVFDGRLIIDTNCQTNDPKIFGAGALTKYSRRFYASKMTHKYFNREEIGYRLGQQIRHMLIPEEYRSLEVKKPSWNIQTDRGDCLVPRYSKPIMRYCRLPGGLYYLSIVKPGRPTPLETAINLESYGQVLVTGTCKNLDRQGFFRLHLNSYRRVETISCLSKFPIDIKSLWCLWGKHEKLLNNLQMRFEMGMISDLYEYFREPWAYAIYHDKFDALLEELNILMTSTMASYSGTSGFSLISAVIDAYKDNNWKPLSQEMMDSLTDNFNNEPYPKLLETKVLDFIRDNLDSLPVYAHPIVVKSILEGFNKSPLFTY
ncbi:hypothetical protein NQ315_000187 [Exocentrus adspersus]|uniref:Cilia- and flagella-associated protein 61 N-terminal domain-containing protein n=1 Tax=Exocentrus adspersus TaxID=1586481 RepID=A0AAV8VQX9_9CUCU|nr:hypothetical protein NQ315_000187 [Exocentrus adspersus]